MRDEIPEKLYFGKYKGYVRANDDPENRDRVRCYCPQVMGEVDSEDKWLGWAEACLPWLGGFDTSHFGPPLTKEQNEGREVGLWIEFEGGKLDFPIYVGCFVIARRPEDGPVDLTKFEGLPGGSIIANPPAGSSLDALNPPKLLPGQKEIRLVAPTGYDIVLMAQSGGALIIGPSGAHITGVQVTANGRDIDANSSQVTG